MGQPHEKGCWHRDGVELVRVIFYREGWVFSNRFSRALLRIFFKERKDPI